MKNIILIALLFAFSACSTQSNFDRFYKNYSQENHVMTLRAPTVLGAFLLDSEYGELFTKGVKSLRVMRLSELQDQRKDRVQRDLAQALSQDGFTPWFSFNEDNTRINVLTRSRMGAMRNVTITYDVGQELYVMNAQTNLSESQLTRLLRLLRLGEKK